MAGGDEGMGGLKRGRWPSREPGEARWARLVPRGGQARRTMMSPPFAAGAHLDGPVGLLGGAGGSSGAGSGGYGHLYPEADAALRDRLDALYGSAQPVPTSQVVRCLGGQAVTPAWPQVRLGTTRAPPMMLRRRSELGCYVVGATGFEPVTSSVSDPTSLYQPVPRTGRDRE